MSANTQSYYWNEPMYRYSVIYDVMRNLEYKNCKNAGVNRMHEIEEPIYLQTELANCIFIKTILMILVILYHSIVFWLGGWFNIETPQFESIIFYYSSQWLNSFHVYGFALVSGYLFFYSKYEKGKYQKFLLFIKNKALRLLVPTVFVSAIWIVPISEYFFNYNISIILNNYILAVSPNQLWFLWMLFDVFIIFWLLSDYFKKHDLIGGVAVIGFYGVSLVGSSVLPNVFQIWAACAYLPLFWLGFKIRQHGSELINKIHWAVWIVVDLALFTILQFISKEDMFFKLLSIGCSFLLHIVGAMMAFVVLQKLANHANWQKSKVFTFLSKRSMPVFYSINR